MQNSRFLQFVSKMSRGELIIDDNQVKPATLPASGDWASEYQQQYNNGPAWADEFARNEASRESIEAKVHLHLCFFMNNLVVFTSYLAKKTVLKEKIHLY